MTDAGKLKEWFSKNGVHCWQDKNGNLVFNATELIRINFDDLEILGDSK